MTSAPSNSSARRSDRGCHAVDVVVAVDGDALAVGDRCEDAIDGNGHVRQRERVEQIVERRRQEPLGLGQIRDSADAEQSRGDRRNFPAPGRAPRLDVIALERLPETLYHSAIPTLPIFRHF